MAYSWLRFWAVFYQRFCFNSHEISTWTKRIGSWELKVSSYQSTDVSRWNVKVRGVQSNVGTCLFLNISVSWNRKQKFLKTENYNLNLISSLAHICFSLVWKENKRKLYLFTQRYIWRKQTVYTERPKRNTLTIHKYIKFYVNNFACMDRPFALNTAGSWQYRLYCHMTCWFWIPLY